MFVRRSVLLGLVWLTTLRAAVAEDAAPSPLEESHFTLSAPELALDAALEEIRQQTGNSLQDLREQFGQEATPRTVSLAGKDLPFWPSLDQMLDAAKLGLYPYSGEEGLGIVDREPGAGPRVGRAVYRGPYRIEPLAVFAHRGLRDAYDQGGELNLEIAWEPRLRPIAFSLDPKDVEIFTDDDEIVPVKIGESGLDVEIEPGSYATELAVPFELPPRSSTKLATFDADLSVVVPAELAEFRFDQLDKPASAKQEIGGVVVELVGVRRNGQLWEMQVKIELAGDDSILSAHRGWVFQNLSYLENPSGNMVDNAGFETYLQTETAVGFIYLFDVPDETLANYTWVYKSPAGIKRVSVRFELEDIALP